MIAPGRLKALPIRLADIARAKKALMPSKAHGWALRERTRRQDDIDALDLAHRILSVVARSPEDFAALFQLHCGAAL